MEGFTDGASLDFLQGGNTLLLAVSPGGSRRWEPQIASSFVSSKIRRHEWSDTGKKGLKRGSICSLLRVQRRQSSVEGEGMEA